MVAAQGLPVAAVCSVGLNKSIMTSIYSYSVAESFHCPTNLVLAHHPICIFGIVGNKINQGI